MLKLLSSTIQTDFLLYQNTTGSTINEGTPFSLNGLYVFAPNKIPNAEKGLIVVKGLVEVNCDNTISYSVGEKVYDDLSAPSGIVNKTSGGTRIPVGYVYETAINPSKIKILFFANLTD